MAKASADRGSSLSRYLKEIGEYPRLAREEEHAVACRVANPGAGEEACRDLVTSNLGFVVKIAGEYKNLGLPFEDLLNEGNVGLVEAARHFDPERGVRFISYAIWWIRKSILKALSRHANMVHIPEHRLKQIRNVRDMRRMLARELGREAGREEISRELHLTVARVDSILQLQMREVGLDDKVRQGNDRTLLDQLVDERSTSPEEEMIRRENRDLLRRALRKLGSQELGVIIDRFGLEGRRACTLREIGERLGLSRERVRQIESQAKKCLGKFVAGRTDYKRPTGPQPLRPRAGFHADQPLALRSSAVLEPCHDLAEIGVETGDGAAADPPARVCRNVPASSV